MGFKEMGESSKKKDMGSLEKLERELKKYMRKALAKGHKFEDIKKNLIEKNWPEHYIHKHYNEINNKQKKGILKKIFHKKEEESKKPEAPVKEIEIKVKKTEPKIKEKEINLINLKRDSKRDEYITDLDLVHNLVENRERVKISDIAANFKVDKNKVEEWGRILEEHNLIKVHYPAIGEPEFVKKNLSIKKIKKKVTKKKKMLISLIVILIVIIGAAALFITPVRKTGNGISIEMPKIIKVSPVEEAFSGKAAYACNGESGEVSIQYFINNKDMRIESKINDENSLIIVKEGYVYTYLAAEDKWIKKSAPESLVVPGDGKIPNIKLSCGKAEVKSSIFSIPENKVVSV